MVYGMSEFSALLRCDMLLFVPSVLSYVFGCIQQFFAQFFKDLTSQVTYTFAF